MWVQHDLVAGVPPKAAWIKSDIAPANATSSGVSGMSDTGQVVGYSQFRGGQQRAYSWTAAEDSSTWVCFLPAPAARRMRSRTLGRSSGIA